jgi:hypothetical protein
MNFMREYKLGTVGRVVINGQQLGVETPVKVQLTTEERKGAEPVVRVMRILAEGVLPVIGVATPEDPVINIRTWIADLAAELGFDKTKAGPQNRMQAHLDFIHAKVRDGQAALGREPLYHQAHADEIERLCQKIRIVDQHTEGLKERMAFYRDRSGTQRSILRAIRRAAGLKKGEVRLAELPEKIAGLKLCHDAQHARVDELTEQVLKNTQVIRISADCAKALQSVEKRHLLLDEDDKPLNAYEQLSKDLAGVSYASAVEPGQERKVRAAPELGMGYGRLKKGVTVALTVEAPEVVHDPVKQAEIQDVLRSARNRVVEILGLKE